MQNAGRALAAAAAVGLVGVLWIQSAGRVSPDPAGAGPAPGSARPSRLEVVPQARADRAPVTPEVPADDAPTAPDGVPGPLGAVPGGPAVVCEGRVLDLDGAPVPGAEVLGALNAPDLTLRELLAAGSVVAVADAAGRFRFEAPDGVFAAALAARSPDGLARGVALRRLIPQADAQQVVLRVVAGARLTVRVPAGWANAHLAVWSEPPGLYPERELGLVVSESEPLEFEVGDEDDVLVPGAYGLQLKGVDFAGRRGVTFAQVRLARGEAVQLSLTPEPYVAVEVLVRHDGAPQPGRVFLRGARGAERGFTPEDLQGAEGADVEEEEQAGHLRFEGDLAEGLETDAEGRLRLELPPGRWTVLACAPGGRRAQAELDLTSAAPQRATLELAAVAPARVRGVSEAAEVGVFGSASLELAVGAAGELEVLGLLEGERAWVRVLDSDDDGLRVGWVELVAGRVEQVALQRAATLQVTLRDDPAGEALGEVFAAGILGSYPLAWPLRVEPLEGPRLPSPMGCSLHVDGSDLWARAPGTRLQPDLEVEDGDGQEHVGTIVDAYCSSTKVLDLVPGRYRLTLGRGSRALVRTVTLSPGSHHEEQFRLAR
ncbi:MAG: hypothetical protein R3F62_14380 [Planctomycetota bacterium]